MIHKRHVKTLTSKLSYKKVIERCADLIVIHSSSSHLQWKGINGTSRQLRSILRRYTVGKKPIILAPSTSWIFYKICRYFESVKCRAEPFAIISCLSCSKAAIIQNVLFWIAVLHYFYSYLVILWEGNGKEDSSLNKILNWLRLVFIKKHLYPFVSFIVAFEFVTFHRERSILYKTIDIKVQVQNVPELWRQSFSKVDRISNISPCGPFFSYQKAKEFWERGCKV